MQPSVTTRSASTTAASPAAATSAARRSGATPPRCPAASSPTEHGAPPLEQPAMLLLDDGGVARERPADLEVLPFDDALRPRDLAADDRVLDRRVGRGGTQAGRNQAVDPVAHQQIVLEADEEPRLAGIALAPRAAAQLQVDAPALVAVRADDIEAAECGHAVAIRLALAAQPDVGAAAGHVGGDRDRAQRAGARDDRAPPRRRSSRSAPRTARPRARSRPASASDSVTVDVPTSTGRPVACARRDLARRSRAPSRRGG